MNLTRKNITFLRDVPAGINVDKTSSWRHHYFEGLSLGGLPSFIKLIGDDKVYLLIPFLGSSQSISKPRLRLSDPFLVDNNSNSFLIIKFIIDQWHSSGFDINETTLISFSFEYKRVWITEI